MNKFLNLILGTTDVQTYLAGLLFALSGLVFYYKGKIAKRDKTSQNTPYQFSLGFFTQDNLVELVFSLLAIFLALRFSVEYFGVDITMFFSLGVGWTLPKVIALMYKIQDKARE
jgi:hypothetical protein